MQLADFELVLSYYQDIGEHALEKFKSMAVFDSIIANTDRHIGNFGVLRDNATGAILDAAPIFDNNVSLFTRYYDEDLDLQTLLERASQAPGMMEATLAWQGEAMLGDMQKNQVERLADFEFDDAGFIASYRESHPNSHCTLSIRRLHVLSDFVRTRARALAR